MRKRFLHFILHSSFLILSSFCFSLNAKIDSLLTILKSAKEDSTKVIACNNLFLQYEFTDSEKAQAFLNQALELSQKVDYNKGLTVTYTYLGYFAEDKGNFQEALKNYFAALKTSERINDKKGIADSYNNIGIVYYKQGNYQDALKNYFPSLKIREALNDKGGIASSHNNIGLVYYATGNYPEALKNYFPSLKIYEAIGNKQSTAASYYNIGSVYCNQNNYPEALKNHLTSLKIRELIGDKPGIAISYNGIGLVYFHQGNYEEALKKYAASLLIEETIGDKTSIAAAHNNIGNVYCLQGDYEKALKNYLTCLKIGEMINDKAGISAAYGNIGYVYMKQKKYNEAYEYLAKAKSLSKKIGDKENLKNAYNTLTTLDSIKRNFKGAYENHKIYILYSDSIDNEETRKKTIQAQMTYDFEIKEAVADAVHKKELEKQQALAEEKSRKQRIVILFVFCGLLLVLIFAGLIFRSLRITKSQKQIIEIQKEKVDVQNEEITKQKLLVDTKNHEISSSISYAKRIQRSFLTAQSIITRHFPEHFILYKPKDIVSGDFYWMHQKGDYSYFCVADCTGHGIPGAFMSLIGMGVLNEIVYSKNIVDTKDILNELRRIVILAVNPEDALEKGQDGMDLVYLRFHLPSKELQYSAANNSFYVFRKGELLEFKPDKMPVGSYGEYEKPFTQHTIQLEEADIIYAITDGYADQFGGLKGKRLQYKELEHTLLSNANLPMQAQSEILNTKLQDWQGDYEQVDDITIIGIKI